MASSLPANWKYSSPWNPNGLPLGMNRRSLSLPLPAPFPVFKFQSQIYGCETTQKQCQENHFAQGTWQLNSPQKLLKRKNTYILNANLKQIQRFVEPLFTLWCCWRYEYTPNELTDYGKPMLKNLLSFLTRDLGSLKAYRVSHRLLTLACISKYIKCRLLYTKQKGMYYQMEQTELIRAVINQIKKYLLNISASPALSC